MPTYDGVMALPPDDHGAPARAGTASHVRQPQYADAGPAKPPREASGPSPTDGAQDTGLLSALDRLNLGLERIHSLLGELDAVFRRESGAGSQGGSRPGKRPAAATDESGEAAGRPGDTRPASRAGVIYGGGPSAFARK